MRHRLKELISVRNQLDTIPLFRALLKQLLRKKQVSEETIDKVSLISEEILSSTISHGYVDIQGNPQNESDIEVTVAVECDHSVYLQFCDEAPPFDPLSTGAQNAYPDRASYVRRYGYNIIELRVEDARRKGDGPT